MDDIHLAWFDYWLKGKETGALDTLAGPTLGNRVAPLARGANAGPWPPGSARFIWAGTARNGSLSDNPPESQDVDRSYRYDPRDPVPTRLDVKRYPIEDVPVEMSEIEARDDVITYTSEPLTRRWSSPAGRTWSSGPAATATTPSGTSS